MLVTERDIEAYLTKRVEKEGGLSFKLPAVYQSGIPDRIIVLPGGRVVFVELKRPKGGELRELQKYQLKKLTDRGCRAYVLKNYAEVDQMIKEVMEG